VRWAEGRGRGIGAPAQPMSHLTVPGRRDGHGPLGPSRADGTIEDHFQSVLLLISITYEDGRRVCKVEAYRSHISAIQHCHWLCIVMSIVD